MGITDYAQAALGDIVYVQLPKVGENITAGKVCGEVESTKSVSDIYAPVSGVVTDVNTSLSDSPETINSDPYGAGWLLKIEVKELPSDLLTSAEYGQITA
jgi:glycine cleavage system H protein